LVTSTVTGPLAGVRVVEVASHVFVPIAGAVLTEWGADVIKIEHPVSGDPYRGLVTAGLHKLHDGIDPQFQSANRGKQSVGLDLKQPEGRALLSRLLEGADVFLTNLRADTIRSLHIDVEDVRADNPDLIYVRGTAFGPHGPDAGRGGYDAGAYWARSGMQHVFTSPDDEWPAVAKPAFGDVVGGLTIAGAISTALYRRATSGEASVVDVSLLNAGMWQVQVAIMNACLDGGDAPPRALPGRYESWNPLMMSYRTRDGRFVGLQMLSPDRYWPDLCKAIGDPSMATDPRFVDMGARRANARECVERLEAIFAARDFAEWSRVLTEDFEGEWVPTQSPHEVSADPQVPANGYLADVRMTNGSLLKMVTAPVQFDERRGEPARAPEHGEHTEGVLLGLGLTWDEIGALKARNVIL
jgi:crotonobetainyl-CoA:carnitine CoA-transferase CaiB-like acyl-CoA transferase